MFSLIPRLTCFRERFELEIALHDLMIDFCIVDALSTFVPTMQKISDPICLDFSRVSLISSLLFFQFSLSESRNFIICPSGDVLDG